MICPFPDPCSPVTSYERFLFFKHTCPYFIIKTGDAPVPCISPAVLFHPASWRVDIAENTRATREESQTTPGLPCFGIFCIIPIIPASQFFSGSLQRTRFRSLVIENFIRLHCVSYVVLCTQCAGSESCLGRVVDILEASGAFDPGSSPGRGVAVFQVRISS